MNFRYRTGETPAVTHGWVGRLFVILFQIIAMAIEILVRLTVAIVTSIARIVRWLWRAANGAGGPDGPIWGEDDVPSGGADPLLTDQPSDLPSGV